jgi:hypothetical protein
MITWLWLCGREHLVLDLDDPLLFLLLAAARTAIEKGSFLRGPVAHVLWNYCYINTTIKSIKYRTYPSTSTTNFIVILMCLLCD